MMRGMRYSPLEGCFAVSIRVVPAVFMAEFQAMFVMYMKSVSIGYGSPLWAFVITRCSMPWAASGASQENALSIRRGRAVGLDQEIRGGGRKPERRPRQRLAGHDLANLPSGLGSGRDRFGIRRLVAKTARHVDRAEQDLQQMQGAAGVKAVGVRRDAAHGVHADGSADRLQVSPPPGVGPRHVQRDRLLERRMRQLGGDPPYGRCRDAGPGRDGLGTVFVGEVLLLHEKASSRAFPARVGTAAERTRTALIGPRWRVKGG